VKGEVVPIRLYLSKLNLSPTYRSVNSVFSLKYYINLVLFDEEDRRYFKQQEIVFWRCAEDTTLTAAEEKMRKVCLLPSTSSEKGKKEEIKVVAPDEKELKTVVIAV
jgi:Vacuolar protein sorting-associated protein 26